MISEAARCVKCGLCLAECPTYRLDRNEALSPRGRISLVQALANGQVEADVYGYEVLYSCLWCRRCEAVCPSEVPFSRVMARGMELVGSQAGAIERVQGAVFSRPGLMRPLSGVGKALLPRASFLGKLLSEISTQGSMSGQLRKPEGAARGRVGLFLGCSGELLDHAAVAAVIELLLHLGFEVDIPARQVCCGAIDVHAGNARRAARLRAQNEQRFSGLDAVLSIASGCGAQLAESAAMVHQDASLFLASPEVIGGLDFRPMPGKALLHIPCTQANVLKAEDAVFTLLGKIPSLEIQQWGETGGCCGAGGTAFLQRRKRALTLRQPLLQQARDADADYLLSGNVSCRLHLQMGLDDEGMKVMHPLVLLAQQLIRD